jgi:hypothetical protein
MATTLLPNPLWDLVEPVLPIPSRTGEHHQRDIRFLHCSFDAVVPVATVFPTIDSKA